MQALCGVGMEPIEMSQSENLKTAGLPHGPGSAWLQDGKSGPCFTHLGTLPS